MKYFVCDFETEVNIERTYVWAYAFVGLWDDQDHVIMGTSIDSFIEEIFKPIYNNGIFFFHNLKFDGEFILYWLLKHGFVHTTEKRLNNGEFSTLITDMGKFYILKVRYNNITITFQDSFAIIPLSVAQMAKAFGMDISKLHIEYTDHREEGGQLTDDDKEYITYDILIVQKGLQYFFDQNLNKITLGSDALADFKSIITPKNFDRYFPKPAYDKDIRRSYKGGFSYVKEDIAGKTIGNGIVLDVNSLYPSRMYYCELPYGEGKYFEGEYIKDEVYNLYIQSITCIFEIKENYLPTIQIKNSRSFANNEYLKNSNGQEVLLTLTSVDLKLFFEHYNVYNLEFHGGWKFKSSTEIFKPFIDKWMAIKIEASRTGNLGLRTLAKLMLNNLYGKFALNPKVTSKIPYLDSEKDIVRYHLADPTDREPIYIPVATFITAHARYYTISSAQKVYDRFCYADTDSLHLIGTDLPNLDIDDDKLGAWKLEKTFTRAKFVRQKTYIEEVNGKLEITCAGMPSTCYDQVTWDNFEKGSVYGGKLMPKHVPGGIVLVEKEFTIRA